MWPPEYPSNVPQEAFRVSKKKYFTHQRHEQAAEVRIAWYLLHLPGFLADSVHDCMLGCASRSSWLCQHAWACASANHAGGLAPQNPWHLPHSTPSSTLPCPNSAPAACPACPLQLRAAKEGGQLKFYQENPRLPYRGAKIMSSQPQFLQDTLTGLNTSMFK
jgi:hypothetical protein